MRLVLIGLVGVAIHNAHAGSAVAWDDNGHFSTAYGGPVQREKQRALASVHHNGWTTAKIIAATDSPGYGAIAIALHPNGYGSVNGIAIGRRSATEAEALAIKECAEEQDLDLRVEPLAGPKVHVVGADFIQDVFIVCLAADFRRQIMQLAAK